MRIELLQKIADGEVAEVHLGRIQTEAGPALVTVYRLLRQVADTEGLIEQLGQSSTAMLALRHDNLLGHLGCGSYQDDFFWVDQRGEGFDLATVLNRLSSREVHINPLRSLQIGMDLAKGLGALHQQGAVFGGLSPDYAVIGYDGVTRLGGIGFESVLFATKDLKQKTRRGRSGLLAPEVMQGRNATAYSDVFAAAAIVYTLLTGQQPLGKEERSGVGVSVRHAGVTPPSKLDRTLPFSCDAVFVKALNTSSKGRHESGIALANALKRLRAAMLKGPDRGHQEVSQFIENLFPNEAVIAGMRGTTTSSTPTGEIEIGGRASGAAALPPASVAAPAPEPQIEPEPGADEPTEPESAPIDPDAAARVAAWEAAMGKSNDAAPSASSGPPPLPGEAKPSGPSPVVEVDWDNLDEETTEDHTPPELVYDDNEQTPDLEQGPDLARPDSEQMPLETGRHDTEQMPLATGEPPPVAEPSRPGDDEIRQESDTLVTNIPPPGAAAAGSAAEQPPRRGSRMLWALGGAGLLVLAALYLIFSGSSTKKQPAKPTQPALTTLGFLSVQTPQPASVTLDGELVARKTPLAERAVRAGKHRLVLKTASGQIISDEEFSIEPGEHKTIKLIGTIAPAPQPVTPKNEVKKTVHRRKRHGRRSHRRSRHRRRRTKTRK